MRKLVISLFLSFMILISACSMVEPNTGLTGATGATGATGVKGDTGEVSLAYLAGWSGTNNITFGQFAESQITNLTTDLGLKAPIASPTFTGTVSLPTVTLDGTLNGASQLLTIGGIAFPDGSRIRNTTSNAYYEFRGGVVAAGGGAVIGLTGVGYGSPSYVFIWTSDNVGTGDTLRLQISGKALIAKATWSNINQTWSSYGAGTITADANGNLTSVSDERLKTNITPYLIGLKQILPLVPIKYNYTKESGLDTENYYAGLNAQEVAKYIPFAVGTNPDGSLTLNDRAVIAVLVNSIKELDFRLTAIEEKLKMTPIDKIPKIYTEKESIIYSTSNESIYKLVK